ncbi:hypothetical protein AVEN_184178-1 [Araneus ventricosus]|uniref:Uncharacterized protein n=1 Tax=Araneus ventricosus TaxID=182803 RepID=A0A4Y2IAW3_ARAVE|nr:hypothetical protein AVEN_184178-1 [Araneus ventricosus]
MNVGSNPGQDEFEVLSQSESTSYKCVKRSRLFEFEGEDLRRSNTTGFSRSGTQTKEENGISHNGNKHRDRKELLLSTTIMRKEKWVQRFLRHFPGYSKCGNKEKNGV